MTDTRVTQTTEQMVPADFGRGEGECKYLRVATIRAIGCEYMVWVNFELEGNAAYVACAPTDGPFDSIANWGYRKRDIQVFRADESHRLNSWRVQDAAVTFAARSASDDILNEMVF